jgi:two-component system sensor histidine kinase AtoS
VNRDEESSVSHRQGAATIVAASTSVAAGAGVDRPARATHVTRLKLMLLLPLAMALLVAATGFFTLNMSERNFLIHGLTGPFLAHSMHQLSLQIVLVALIAAVLGLGIALSVAAPLGEMASKLEAIASGDLRGAVDIRSTTEVDTLAGAFNDAIGAINRYVFQSMTGAVITLNPAGTVIGSSPATEAILGYREEEIVGKQFSEVFAPSGGGRQALAAIEAAIARGDTVAADDLQIATKDGRPVRIGVNVSYLGPRAGGGSEGGADSVGVMIAFKDLTEIRRLRDRLQQADQLVALGTLTAGVAHELRNPLASLQGLVELLGRDFPDGDPRRRYVTTMLEAIGRLDRLVEDLLLLSAPGAPTSDEIALGPVVRETVMLAGHGLGGKQVDLRCDEAAEGLVVRGNPLRIGQALSNIVANAVQATSDRGAVRVRVDARDGHAVVSVHNTGSYIEPEQMKQLFVPFYTTKPAGTGLGLAIARQIVSAHGGRIDVDSARGHGTTFTMELPLVRQAEACCTSS